MDLAHCEWGVVMDWNEREFTIFHERWENVLPRFEFQNQTLRFLEKLSKRESKVPGLFSHITTQIEENHMRRRELICDVIKASGILMMVYKDPVYSQAGLFLDRPLLRRSEEIRDGNYLCCYPRTPNNGAHVRALHEMFWDEDLWTYMTRWQSPGIKRDMLRVLGLECRPAPNGWIRIYEHQNYFRFTCLGLQVNGKHHTEYFIFMKTLGDKKPEYKDKMLQKIINLPKNAVMTNQAAMKAIDGAILKVLHPNTRPLTSVIVMPWVHSEMEYDYSISGPLIEGLKKEQQCRSLGLSETYDLCYKNLRKRKGAQESYRDEVEMYQKHESIRIRVDNVSFKELCSTSPIDDSKLTQVLKGMGTLSLLYIMKGCKMKHLKHPRIQVIYESVAAWCRPPVVNTPFPGQLKLNISAEGYEQRVWNQYVDCCRENFLKHAEDVRVKIFKDGTAETRFPYPSLVAFADRFIELYFKEEIDWIRYEIFLYLTEHISDLIASQQKMPDWELAWTRPLVDLKKHSQFYQIIEENSGRLREEWVQKRKQQQLRNEQLEERRDSWWHYQMSRLFGRRREDQVEELTLQDPPKLFDLSEANGSPTKLLTLEMVEDWMIEKLVQEDYPPNQVADFWRRCNFKLKEESITKLQRKILGNIQDFQSPQKFVKRFKVLLKIGRLSGARLEEIYYQGERRWGKIVLQTAVRSGIPRREWISLYPEGSKRFPWDLRAPIMSSQPSTPRSIWENPIWKKIRMTIGEQVDQIMKMDITPKDRSFCVQVQAQVRQAIRMNRARMWDLIEAWRFFFEHFRHPDRGEDLCNRFESWRQKKHHKLSESAWDYYGAESWCIRLKDGRKITIPTIDEEELEIPWDPGALLIRDSLIELWRLIRSAQLIDFDDNVRGRPSDSQYDRIYAELQLEIELLSLSLGRDLPNEIMAWISFKHRGPPPRRKSLPQCIPQPIPIDSQEPTRLLTADCPIQGPEEQNSGPRNQTLDSASFKLPYSCSTENLVSYRSVEERIKLRHQKGRTRFRLQRKCPTISSPEMSILLLEQLGLDGIVICSSDNPIQSPHSDDERMLMSHVRNRKQPSTRCDSDPGPEFEEFSPCSIPIPQGDVYSAHDELEEFSPCSIPIPQGDVHSAPADSEEFSPCSIPIPQGDIHEYADSVPVPGIPAVSEELSAVTTHSVATQDRVSCQLSKGLCSADE
jgi:hypothetical protein